MKLIDRAGQRFGHLTVIGLSGERRRGIPLWTCRCDCGGETQTVATNLVTGNTKSCGCLSSQVTIGDRVRTHGLSKHPVHLVWNNMKRRCHDARNVAYARYGGRGIFVCDRWRTSLANFVADMGLPPAHRTLERRDNDGPYSPENCYWATVTEQANNKSNNRLITHAGDTLTLAQWARRIGINQHALLFRLQRGWSVERALTEPHCDETIAPITFRGRTRTLNEWAQRIGISRNTLSYRLFVAKWPLDEALRRDSTARRRTAARNAANKLWHG